MDCAKNPDYRFNHRGNIIIWFKDGYASAGHPENLESWRALYPYVIPPGEAGLGRDNYGSNIEGMGIAPDTGYVFTWYKDERVGLGSSDNLACHRGGRLEHYYEFTTWDEL